MPVKFLSTTLLHKVNNLLRKQIRRGTSAGGDRIQGASSTPGPLASLPAQTRGVLTRTIHAESHGTVLRAIQELANADREVVALRAIEQHSNQETAELLGPTPNAISLRYNRALKTLASALPDSAFRDL